MAAFLAESRQAAAQEDGTVTWYAFKAGGAVYDVSGTFATEEARSAYLSGEIPVALGAVASRLLAAGPKIRVIDIIAGQVTGAAAARADSPNRQVDRQARPGARSSGR